MRGVSPEHIILPLTFATVVMIVVLSLWRGDSRFLAPVPHWLAKLWHFLAYGLLAYLCVSVLDRVVPDGAARAAAGFLLATSLGALMEYLQKFRVGRFARVSDVLIDAAGAALGTSAALW